MCKTTSERFGGAFFAALMVGTALAGMGGTNLASAQQASAAQQRTFQIAAQPLASALTQLGQQSGMQVSVDAAAVRGLTSPGVSGSLTISDAAARLLAGSGLSYRIEGRTVVISDRVSNAHAVPAADGSLVLDVIDVTGGRGAADAPFETAGSVNHISAEQISRTPPTSVGDMFRSTPGVVASGNRVGASVDVNIRGLQGQNRVNVMVDGTRQTNNSYRGYRGSRNETYVDPDFLGGIDISKGPFAGAGGVGAMGGVVNMRTIEARDIVKEGENRGVRVKGSLGSNTTDPPAVGARQMRRADSEFFNGDAWSGSVAAAMLEDNYEFVVGVSRRRAGNYFSGSEGKSTYRDTRVPWLPPREALLSSYRPGQEVFNTSQDVTSFLSKGKARWGDGHSLSLGYTYYQNHYGDIDESSLAFSLPGSVINLPLEQAELATTKTHTVKAGYAYQPEGSDTVDFQSNLWFTDVNTESWVNSLSSGGKGLAHARTVGGDVSNMSKLDTAIGELSLKTGAEFVYEQAREQGATFNWGYAGANPNGNRMLASVFSQSKLDVTDWLALSGSLRYDHYESEGVGPSRFAKKSDGRLNPALGVTITPLTGLQLFGTYTEGWRPPSLRETSAFQQDYLVPNPDLKPELSKNFEFGINLMRDDVLVSGDSLRFKVARFDNSYEDYVVRARPAGLYTWLNIDDARFSGYEFSAAYDTGTVFVEGGLTVYDDMQFCNTPPGGSVQRCGIGQIGTDYGAMGIPPKYSGNVTAGMRLFEEKMTVGARAYFFGQRYGGYGLVPGSVNPPVFYYSNVIVDLFGSYKFTKDMALDFSVENVGDRYYLDPMSTSIVPSPGRTFRAGLTAKF